MRYLRFPSHRIEKEADFYITSFRHLLFTPILLSIVFGIFGVETMVLAMFVLGVVGFGKMVGRMLARTKLTEMNLRDDTSRYKYLDQYYYMRRLP